MLASVSPKFKDWLFENRDSTSAACASLVSTIGGFPLESVKSRIQVKRYSGVLDCISKTYQAEGYGGFFRGVTIPLLTVTFVRTGESKRRANGADSDNLLRQLRTPSTPT